MAENLTLSPSTLGLFKECPRCFWVHIKHGHKRPMGPFPSLPSGLDLLIKAYFDQFRGSLPLELEGKVDGVLFEDLKLLEKWRDWRKGLRVVDPKSKVELVGALDDCLVSEGYFIPLDYKTRGFDLKDDSMNYYKHQLDLYTLMLDRNGYKTRGEAYLLYYIPKTLKSGKLVEFEVTPLKVETSIDDARKLIRDAIKLLEGPIPPHHEGCEFCRWQKRLEELS
jgi:CRISPR/Cas system-associated exonuclease Cas4 (RecB family)